MYKVPFKVDLTDKTVAVTGAGGIICGEFAKALAACGAKVALLDINYDAAEKIAEEIGENAFAVKCNCLDKDDIKAAKKAINDKFGKVNFLINGAGGNDPKCTTAHEEYCNIDNNIAIPERCKELIEQLVGRGIIVSK